MSCNHLAAYEEILETIPQDPHTIYSLKKAEFVTNSWFRLTYNDRHLFLDVYPKIKSILQKHNLTASLNTGWWWEDVPFDGMLIHNPTPTYQIFVCADSRQDFKDELYNHISDTTDPMYDI